MNRLSSILGALLSYGLGHAADGLTVLNWKLIDLVSALVAVYEVSSDRLRQVVGSMTMAWGFVISLYLPDGPYNGKMFTKYE